MKYLPVFVISFVFLLSVGCGKGYVPMGGKVTFSDDGTPLTKGTVCFEFGSEYARGPLDDQGNYILGYNKPGSGLPRGEYKVYVVDALVEDGTVETSGSTGTYARPTYKSLIDSKYSSGSTSGLTFTVDGKEKTFDFKVDRAK